MVCVASALLFAQDSAPHCPEHVKTAALKAARLLIVGSALIGLYGLPP
jgi:hypothetical protein